jgi:hypothetical protein
MNSELFEATTIDPSIFQIQDVEGDNACFYRAIANYLYFGSPNTSNRSVLSMKNWGKVKNIDKVTKDFGRYSGKQDLLARFLQNEILDFISKNYNKKVPFLGNVQLKDAITLVHEISWEEYLMYYSTFAGDIDFNQLEEEAFYIDRWGSTLEQWVITQMLEVPIIIFNTQNWNKRYNKITNGKIVNNKPQKGVRLKPTVILGQEFLGKKMPIYLIWREYHGEGHYMVCYPKDIDNTYEIIKNMI